MATSAYDGSRNLVVNGIERVVVSQLIRSAGLFTSEAISGRRFYGAKIIPNRGAWLEVETDGSGVIYVKIDRKRKVPVTSSCVHSISSMRNC